MFKLHVKQNMRIMKKILLFVTLVGICSGINAQELKTIQLNKPNTQRGLPVMQALEKRQSTREYADKALNLQDLSDLLWAANGINRPEPGKRTAPTAMNKQEIDVYVCLPEGAYLYEAKTNSLKPVAKGDFRPAVGGGQAFVAKAPVCIVVVGDLAPFKGDASMPSMDAGIVSQNISIFCAGTGLVTVPRASMDQAKLRSALKLKDSQRLFMNHPVGYAK